MLIFCVCTHVWSCLFYRAQHPAFRDICRRRKEAQLIQDLVKSLPLQGLDADKMTKGVVLRLALQYIKLHKLLSGPGACVHVLWIVTNVLKFTEELHRKESFCRIWLAQYLNQKHIRMQHIRTYIHTMEPLCCGPLNHGHPSIMDTCHRNQMILHALP